MTFGEHENKLLNQLAILFCFVAGALNSVAFLSFGSFVSHVSGHTMHAVIEYSEGHSAIGFLFLFTTLCFILGSAFTAFFLEGRFLTVRHKNALIPLLLEGILIFFVYVDSLTNFHIFNYPFKTIQALHTCILSFAMGLQNALLRKSSGVNVRTTHITGLATDIGISLGWFFTKLFKIFNFKINDRSSKIRLIDFYSQIRFETFRSQFILLFSFCIGATLGTLGYFKYHYSIFLILAFCIFAITFFQYKRANKGDALSSQGFSR